MAESIETGLRVRKCVLWGGCGWRIEQKAIDNVYPNFLNFLLHLPFLPQLKASPKIGFAPFNLFGRDVTIAN
jgi:hypothetical protein